MLDYSMTEGYGELRKGAAWIDVSARGRLTVHGRDRARFLHNVTSNEVKKMTPGSGCYAFLLSAQGRIQADVVILGFAEHFLIDTEPDLRETVPQLILRYKVADQVEVEDVTGRTWALGLEGPGAAAVLASLNAPVPGADYAHVQWDSLTVAAVTVTGQPGFRIYGTEGKTEVIRKLEAAGAKAATEEDARAVRIENGKPRYGDDIRQATLPQETQQMQALSFTKGCYLGQEIVERIRAQGHVNKKLVRLEIDTDEIAAGTKLSAEGADAGEITSAVRSPETGKVAAIGYVRTAQAAPGTELRAGGATARVL